MNFLDSPLIDLLITYRLEIAGTLCTAVVVAYLASLNNRRNRHAAASDAFRSAFDEAVHDLETKPFCDRDILNRTFRTHELAMIKFRPHISWIKRGCFNKDWKKYEEYCWGRVDVPLPFLLGKEVSDLNGPDDSKEIDARHREAALTHIKKLLAYTHK